MSLRYLLDENLRGALWDAIQDHNARGQLPFDVLRVGDQTSPALGTADGDLLLWCEAEGRILVTLDKNTIPGTFTAHSQAGHHSPGVFIVRLSCTLAEVVSFLVAAAYASDPLEWQDFYTYIP